MEGEGEQEELMIAAGARLRASWCGTPPGTLGTRLDMLILKLEFDLEREF